MTTYSYITTQSLWDFKLRHSPSFIVQFADQRTLSLYWSILPTWNDHRSPHFQSSDVFHRYRSFSRTFFDVELQVLPSFLKVLHAVQTTLCAEKTPTLSAVLRSSSGNVTSILGHLSTTKTCCIAMIEEYVNKSRKTCIYALAMAVFVQVFHAKTDQPVSSHKANHKDKVD